MLKKKFPMQSWATILANIPSVPSQTSCYFFLLFKQCFHILLFMSASYRSENTGSGNERRIPSSWNFMTMNRGYGGNARPRFPTYLHDFQWCSARLKTCSFVLTWNQARSCLDFNEFAAGGNLYFRTQVTHYCYFISSNRIILRVFWRKAFPQQFMLFSTYLIYGTTIHT